MPNPARKRRTSLEKVTELLVPSVEVQRWVSPGVPSRDDIERLSLLVQRNLETLIEHTNGIELHGPDVAESPPDGVPYLQNANGSYHLVESVIIHAQREVPAAPARLEGEAYVKLTQDANGRIRDEYHIDGLPRAEFAAVATSFPAAVRFLLDDVSRGHPPGRGKWSSVADFLAAMRTIVREFRQPGRGWVPTIQRVAEYFNRPSDDNNPMDTDSRVSERTLQNWRRRAGFETWTGLIEHLSQDAE
jgi:hypothetical protein